MENDNIALIKKSSFFVLYQYTHTHTQLPIHYYANGNVTNLWTMVKNKIKKEKEKKKSVFSRGKIFVLMIQ